jgi:hypothetical protein
MKTFWVSGMKFTVFVAAWSLAFAGISLVALSCSVWNGGLSSRDWHSSDSVDSHAYNASDVISLVNYTMNPTITEVNSDPATWLYRYVHMKGVLEYGVLEDDSTLQLGLVYLVSSTSSGSILVFWDSQSAEARSNLIGRSVVIAGYIERADTIEHYFGSHHTRYFILPLEVTEAKS